MWPSALPALAAAIVLPAWCAQRGLRRLAPDVSLSGAELHAAAAAGALGGLAAARVSQSDDILSGATVILCGFLAAAAIVDWRTSWAPTELVLPICIAAGLCAGAETDGLPGLILSSAAVGGGVFLSAWALFLLQARAGQVWFPPADTIALAMPLFLLQTNLAKAAQLLAVAAVLLAVKWFPAQCRGSGSGRLALPEGRVALLAVACPVFVTGMLVETLLVHATNGSGARDGWFSST